jgi:hypothetical protein
MDDCPNNTKVDLAVRNVLGQMKLIRELHRLHIMKEASNAQRNAINGEVTVYSFRGQIWTTLQPLPYRLVTAGVELLWKPCLVPCPSSPRRMPSAWFNKDNPLPKSWLNHIPER